MVSLIKKNEHIIGFGPDNSTKICERLPISDRRYREIMKLTTKSRDIQSFFDFYKKVGEYCLSNFSQNDFDSMIWESNQELEHEKGIFGLKQIIESCIYRSVYGIAYFHQPLKIG
jgi:hypothetical protein